LDKGLPYIVIHNIEVSAAGIAKLAKLLQPFEYTSLTSAMSRYYVFFEDSREGRREGWRMNRWLEELTFRGKAIRMEGKNLFIG
jgi:hypothetical protein